MSTIEQRQAIQKAYGAWREADRTAASQRGGGYISSHQRATVRDAARAYVAACEAAGEQPMPSAIRAASEPAS